MGTRDRDSTTTGFTLLVDGHPNRSSFYATCLARHQLACKNLKHVSTKTRCGLPTIQSIYHGNAAAACAPAYLGLTVLFTHFNQIAQARFVADPSLGKIVCGLIILYGMDKARCFVLKVTHCRWNLVFIVFIWTAINAGKAVPKYNASKPLWSSYLCAWLESLNPSNGFAAREKFLDEWMTSEYDIAWFTKGKQWRFVAGLRKLEEGLPPMGVDPVALVKQCGGDYMRLGPAMALRFLLAQDEAARKEGQERKAFEMAMEAVQGGFSALTARDEVSGGEDEEESKPASEQDRMDIDDDEYPVPDGVDLTTVPWDNAMLQALLNIDTTIGVDDAKNRTHTESGRIPWITGEEGLSFLKHDVDALLDAFASLGLDN